MSTTKGAKSPRKPKPKPLPVVEWTPVPVHLPLYDAEARFHIREFVLRFADLFEPSLPRTNLEELEEIGGGRHQGRDEDDDLVSWVSEFCVKSIIVGLLNLLAKELQGPLSPVTAYTRLFLALHSSFSLRLSKMPSKKSVT